MKALQVKISGRLAHFRKVFSNSTSLSYYFPPRTTIAGMLAAALGLERDSYYEKFDSSKLKIGIEALTPLRKLTFSETYLDTDEINLRKLRGLVNRVPITREYITASEGDYLAYAFYFYPAVPEYKKAFSRPVYPISLGPANMLSWVEEINEIECNEIDDLNNRTVYGAVPAESILGVEPESEIIIEEGMPRDFTGDRRSGKLFNYYFSINSKKYNIKSGKADGLECMEGKKTIVFL
ncbi:MAG: CRISPR-associated protein Cas5 [Nitrososphaeria archaeon]